MAAVCDIITERDQDFGYTKEKEKTEAIGRRKNMKKHLRLLIFFGVGALLGLGYYYLFGCSGNCAVTSNPWMTMAYMGIIGGLLSEATKKKEAA